RLDKEVKGWLAFAEQKLAEVAALARGVDEGEAAIAAQLEVSDAAVHSRRTSTAVHRPDVAARLAAVTPDIESRTNPYPARRTAQQPRLGLPLFPTTTIGSFPQTTEVRRARARMARGELTGETYDSILRTWIDDAVRWQEEIGLDVL